MFEFVCYFAFCGVVLLVGVPFGTLLLRGLVIFIEFVIEKSEE